MYGKKYKINSIKEILTHVSACIKIHLTKNGKVYSSIAEDFLDWINEYSKYYIPEERKNWEKITRELIYSPMVLKTANKPTPEIQKLIDNREYAIIDDLHNFIDAGEVMKTLATTNCSWEKVDEILQEQGHTGYTFSGLSNIMLRFSPYGIDFIDKYDPDRIQRDKKFKNIYTSAKEKKLKN